MGTINILQLAKKNWGSILAMIVVLAVSLIGSMYFKRKL